MSTSPDPGLPADPGAGEPTGAGGRRAAGVDAFVAGFRSSSPYIHAHRGRTFVVMVGGDALESPTRRTLVQDLVLLTTLGIRLVVVHGARPQIDAAITRAGFVAERHHGMRVTAPAVAPYVRDAIAGQRAELEALFSVATPGTPGARVVTGNFVVARPVGIVDGVDFGLTGTVRRVDARAIRTQLDAGAIVLQSCIGFSPSGETFNLFAEELAAEIAVALKADKLIVFDAEAAVLDADGRQLPELAPAELDALLADGDCANDPARLRALSRAVRAGVPRAHLVGFREDGALVRELFTREGAGTQVTEERYETVRAAVPDDVGGIIELIAPLEASGALVPRPRSVLEREIEYFLVADLDGLIIGCAALMPLGEPRSGGESAGELACFATHPGYRARHPHDPQADDDLLTVGEVLLLRIEGEARRQGMTRLFALTTQTVHWFVEHGFELVAVEELPPARRALYNPDRKSRVLCKHL